jgi:hypothetical protein
LQKLVSTIREPPGRWWLDKVLTQELLDMTDLEHKKVRDLHLYVCPLEGESMEVLVFDNELPIYHTTVADVTLRKSPYWQEMVSIRNIRKIMNDKEETLSLGLRKGAFSKQSDLDLAWVMQYAQGEKIADLQGIDVFEFLAELALEKAQAQRGRNRGTNDK